MLFSNNRLLVYSVCCEAVRSVILATAWFLVCDYLLSLVHVFLYNNVPCATPDVTATSVYGEELAGRLLFVRGRVS